MGRSYIFPLGLSILLHVALAAVMVWGWEATPEKNIIAKPNYIQAKLVSLEDQSKKKAASKKTRKVDLTAKRKEQERLERERKKKLAQKKKRAEEARKRAEQEKQRQAEAERLRLEEQERAEALREQARLQQLQEEFDEALLEEEGLLLEDQFATEAQSYVAVISQRIERNWSRPPSARKGMQCELLIQLVPTGKVVNVSVVKSSGNAAFDRSAEQAVKKIDRFPEIQDMPTEIFERYYRSLRLVFNPQDLRQ